jgi:hypothetical protein
LEDIMTTPRCKYCNKTTTVSCAYLDEVTFRCDSTACGKLTGVKRVETFRPFWESR